MVKDYLLRYDAALAQAGDDAHDLRAHVQRWINDKDAREALANLKKAVPGLRVEKFIDLVVKMRTEADLHVKEVEAYQKTQKDVAKLHETLQKRRLPGPLTVENMIRLTIATAYMTEVLQEYTPKNNFELIRQGGNADRARALFVPNLAAAMRVIFRLPHYGEIAALTTVAFPDKEMTANMVRDICTGQRGKRRRR